jgi:hypothetical protein
LQVFFSDIANFIAREQYRLKARVWLGTRGGQFTAPLKSAYLTIQRRQAGVGVKVIEME